MEITSWYQWLLLYLYDVSAALLVIGGLLVWRQGRRVLGAIIAVAFVAHLSGNHLMLRANAAIVEAQQVHSSTASASHAFVLGRVLSSVCFLVGSASYVVLAWGRRSASKSDV